MFNNEPARWRALGEKVVIDIRNSPPCLTELIPSSFDITNINNYQYELDVKLSESINMDRNILFQWQDKDNWYDIKLTRNNVSIQKVINGQVMPINNAYTTYGFYQNETYHFKIVISDHNIKLYIDDNQLLSVRDDSPYISGYKTVGLQASVGSISTSVTEFDNILVTSLEETPSTLPVPQYKQTDLQWADHEYDHALSWNPENFEMKRWGCAVTSAAMILNFHGITLLLDGTPINPATLNAWLKSQDDGYVYGGLVNWFALGRLTRLISQQHGTPKLEYSRSNGSDLSTAMSEIQSNKPVMFEIPGHFFVGKGASDANNIEINDPFYNYTKLSEHNTTVVSTRMFQPSQTDLSGIMAATSDSVDLDLLLNDNTIPNLSKTTEYINSPDINQHSPIARVIELIKPQSGNYTLVVNSEEAFTPFVLNLHVYNKNGDAFSKKVTGVTNADKKMIVNFEFDGDNPVLFVHNSSFETLKHDLAKLYTRKQLKRLYLHNGLVEYITLAQGSNVNTQLRYIQVLQFIVNHHSAFLSLPAKTFLLQELELIKENLT